MIPGKRLTLSLWLLIAISCFSQQQVLPLELVTKLDSVRMCTGKEKHFGELYLQTTHLAEKYIETLPDNDRQLMKKLEESFAIYFFRAIDSSNKNAEVSEEWRNYFNGNYSPLQLRLMGANAHINGDIWQALAYNFSVEEIRRLKPFYKNYDRSIRKIYEGLFESGIRTDKRLHDLHVLTLGLDKVYGRMMLQKWRNRQMRLAILKFEDQDKFVTLKKKVDRKRNNIDNMIIRRLHVKT